MVLLETETFTTLLRDSAHWKFELFVGAIEMLVVDVLVGAFVWPLIKKHIHRDIKESEGEEDFTHLALAAKVEELEKRLNGMHTGVADTLHKAVPDNRGIFNH